MIYLLRTEDNRLCVFYSEIQPHLREHQIVGFEKNDLGINVAAVRWVGDGSIFDETQHISLLLELSL